MKSKTGDDRKLLQIRSYFETLLAAWGPQHWWPAESPFEVIVGAILTQNTAWTNVEKALANMRAGGALSMGGVRRASIDELETMLRPAGYFRQKSSRLKSFVAWIDERFQGSLDQMFEMDTIGLRTELLSITGIGPETADSILLYAAQHEIFVVDAYTRRIFERHQLIGPDARYDEIRRLVEIALQDEPQIVISGPDIGPPTSLEPGPGPAEELLTPVVHAPSAMSEMQRSQVAQRYNEFHALLVQVAKHYCQSRIARCDGCPLRAYLPAQAPPPQGHMKSARR